MHIPDGMMTGAVCPVTAVLSAAGVAGAAYAAAKTQEKPSPARFGAICALIFAAQMLNFPVSGGTSGHLLGGVLAAAALGIPFGILAISLVVAVQCLVFADGGMTVLGANILNMALIGAGAGGWLLRRMEPHLGRAAVVPAAFSSVMLAAAAASLELGLAGAATLSRVLPAMLGIHALIGAGEGILTLGGVLLLEKSSEPVRSRKGFGVPLAAALLLGMLAAPFASSLPDGLEWVAEKYHFLHEAAPVFVSPLADYSFPARIPEALSTALAGAAGVALTFALAWLLGRTVLPKGAANRSR